MHPFKELEISENALGIHWFGQNSFAFKDPPGTILLVDPYFPRERPAADFIHTDPPLYEEELKTDMVLLTHDHGDHTCPESLQRIHAAFPRVCFYGPAESISRLRTLGLPEDRLFVLTAGDTQYAGNITIHAVSSKPPVGVPEEEIPPPDVEHLGYVIAFGSIRVYISGDLIHSFSSHAELLQPVIQLKPQVGLLTTHPTEGEFPDFVASVEMALKLGLKAAIPAHYGCFIQRTFDPAQWAAAFSKPGPEPILIPYNTSILYTP